MIVEFLSQARTELLNAVVYYEGGPPNQYAIPMSNRFTWMRFERFSKPTPPAPDPVVSERDSTRFWTAVSSIAACGATLFAGWAAWETRASALEAAPVYSIDPRCCALGAS
jgi:hypothetical protein